MKFENFEKIKEIHEEILENESIIDQINSAHLIRFSNSYTTSLYSISLKRADEVADEFNLLADQFRSVILRACRDKIDALKAQLTDL